MRRNPPAYGTCHIGDSDDTSFGDFIEDKAADNPMEEAGFSMLKDKIKDVLDTLTEREREVLEQRFGLKDGYSRTLEEVGRQFRVTRECIRQIEAKALGKMCHPTRIRGLEARASGPSFCRRLRKHVGTGGPIVAEGGFCCRWCRPPGGGLAIYPYLLIFRFDGLRRAS